MKNKIYVFLVSLLGVYFLAYVTTLLLRLNMANDILSAVGFLLIFAIALNLAIKRKALRLPVLSASMAFLTWGLVDVLRVVFKYILHTDTEASALFVTLYLIPSVFFALALIVFFVQQQKRSLTMLQLMVDIFATVLTVLMVLWILVFHAEYTKLVRLDIKTLCIFIYTLFDIFIISCAVIGYIAVPRYKRTLAVNLFCAGVMLQSVTDIVYTYLYLQDLYVANSFIDAMFSLAILIIAVVAVHETYRPGIVVENILPEPDTVKTGKYFKRAYLLLTPILIVLLGRNINALEILLVLSIALAHLVVTNYIQNVMRNKNMLEQQMAVNALLEDCVTERTAQLLQINQELEILSKQDSITNLYNRRYFITALDDMLSNVSDDECVALFFIDLDHFKSINDAYGHDIGDKVLIEAARRMSACARENSILARLGGDEFIFAFRGRYDMDHTAEIAEEIIAGFNEPILVEPYAFNVTLCVGITFYPADAADGNSLMKNADIAMYCAKNRGFNQYAFFSALRNKNILRRYDIEMMLKNADYDKEFEVHYQPVFKLPEGRLLGAEALLRWNSPKGLIMPKEFIPIAEETGIIVPLGEWVLRKTFAQIADWNARTGLDLQLNVNLSPKQLDSLGLTDTIFSLLRSCRISPGWVDIAITESVPMREKAKMSTFFKKISKAGVTVTIDDFGSGYFSLINLRHIPVDLIKIPKILVDSIATDKRDASIAKAIVSVAKALNIRVIAGGVENSQQCEILNAFGCDEIQGYLSGRPASASAFENLYLLKDAAEVALAVSQSSTV